MGRADDANVDGVLLRRADLAHLLFLDRAQELHLHLQGEIGDLVQKQRSSVRGLKEPVAIGFGPGERALPIAEELALHQVLGDGSAVDGDERQLGARAAGVDHPGGELLAAAGLAVDEHRRLAFREALDHVADVHHRRGFAEEAVARRGRRLLGDLERLLDERSQLLERHGLREIVECAGFERGHRILRAAIGRDHRDGQVETFLVDVLDDAQSRPVRQPHVGEAQIERIGIEQSDGLADRLGAGGVEAHARQRELQQFEQIGFVVDQEDSGLAAGFSGHGTYLLSTTGWNARFMVTRKYAPGSARQELQRGAVRVGELAGDVQTQARCRPDAW